MGKYLPWNVITCLIPVKEFPTKLWYNTFIHIIILSHWVCLDLTQEGRLKMRTWNFWYWNAYGTGFWKMIQITHSSFTIKGFKHYNLPREVSTFVKFTQQIHQFTIFQTISSTCSITCQKIWTIAWAKVVSWVITKGWEQKVGKGPHFKMEVDHDWSEIMGLYWPLSDWYQ